MCNNPPLGEDLTLCSLSFQVFADSGQLHLFLLELLIESSLLSRVRRFQRGDLKCNNAPWWPIMSFVQMWPKGHSELSSHMQSYSLNGSMGDFLVQWHTWSSLSSLVSGYVLRKTKISGARAKRLILILREFLTLHKHQPPADGSCPSARSLSVWWRLSLWSHSPSPAEGFSCPPASAETGQWDPRASL